MSFIVLHLNISIYNSILMNTIYKRLREKVFTEKRQPYKSYLKATWKWSDIFNEITNLKLTKLYGCFTIIASKYGILYKTLVDKYNKFKNNKIIVDNKEHRGGHNKFFNYNDELNLFNYFKDNFINKNELLCDEIIKIKAVEESKILYPTKLFLGSSGWCYTFKIKWNLTTVSCSVSRKATTTYTIEELNIFLKECKTECERVGIDNFYNSDEMKCNNINVSSTTIHIKGTDNAKIKVNGNEKEGVSTMLTITANGKMLKPIIIAKGKTNTCLRKYKLKDNVIASYSNNGWMNQGIMKLLIDDINKNSNNNYACLLLDQYSSHCTEYIKTYALSKKIKLIYVPKGYTYKLQPLDVGINSIIKQKSKSIWRTEKIKNPDLKITNEDAVKHLMTSINSLNKETIVKAFTKSCFLTKYE